jgi:hypothetical protein
LARDPEGSRLDGAVATGSRTELTLESSVTYLLSVGLLDVASLVRHGLQIEEVPGRNRNFRVLGGPGQAFFLKQAPRGEIGTNGPLAVEASLYEWVAADATATALRSVFPRRRHYDPERSILVLDLVTGAAHPHVLQDEASSDHLTALRRLVATALAECHAQLVPRDLGLGLGLH